MVRAKKDLVESTAVGDGTRWQQVNGFPFVEHLLFIYLMMLTYPVC